MSCSPEAESDRLKAVMDTVGNVTVFLSEGADVDSVVAEMQARGVEVPRDPYGHVEPNLINPGAWFGEQFIERRGGEKVLYRNPVLRAVRGA
jgi:pyrophosphate--fructose-6-phosphate 1-phosphotransferase